MNSFAMNFEPLFRMDTAVAEAALKALNLFFGIGINCEPALTLERRRVRRQSISASSRSQIL